MDQFIQLERVGNGYFVKTVEGRSDAVMNLKKYVVGASVDFNTGVAFEDFNAVVAGAFGDGVASMGVWMVQDTSDMTWHIKSGVAGGMAAFVVVMFISKAFCTDSTGLVQA